MGVLLERVRALPGVRGASAASPMPLDGAPMVMGESLGLILVGAALGVGTALVATRGLPAFLFEMSASDPASLALVSALVVAAGLLPASCPHLGPPGWSSQPRCGADSS